MLTKRTIIGVVLGGFIVSIGLAALLTSIGLQTISLDDTYDVAELTVYEFSSPAGSYESIKIQGELFDVRIDTSGDFSVPKETFKKEASFDWSMTQDGTSRIEIRNIGSTEIHVGGTLQYTVDTVLFTYHILVITAGIVIIGFSAGFSIRKPKGF